MISSTFFAHFGFGHGSGALNLYECMRMLYMRGRITEALNYCLPGLRTLSTSINKLKLFDQADKHKLVHRIAPPLETAHYNYEFCSQNANLRVIEASNQKKNDDVEKTIQLINTRINQGSCGRLFAIVHIRGHQHRITTHDLLMVDKDIEAAIGDVIILEKVLLVGCADFTVLGRPMLPRDLVQIEATVVEKNAGHINVRFMFKKRSEFRRTRFKRNLTTTLRINGINFTKDIDTAEDLAGFQSF